jgi:hypothetical protein
MMIVRLSIVQKKKFTSKTIKKQWMMIRTKIIVINKLSVKRKKIIYFFITKYFFIKQ